MDNNRLLIKNSHFILFHCSLEETINAKNIMKDSKSKDKNKIKRVCCQRFLTGLIRYRLE
jgi:hypothetical protein